MGTIQLIQVLLIFRTVAYPRAGQDKQPTTNGLTSIVPGGCIWPLLCTSRIGSHVDFPRIGFIFSSQCMILYMHVLEGYVSVVGRACHEKQDRIKKLSQNGQNASKNL